MTRRPLSAVVMAAGEGTRMRSARPKPLHLLAGQPMLVHVLDALVELSLTRAAVNRVVVVVGHGAELVTKALQEGSSPALTLDFVEQRPQRGTGDALAVALTAFPDAFGVDVDDATAGFDLEDGDLLVLPGDMPLLRPATLAALVREHRRVDAAVSVLTAHLPNPSGYGRIVRGKDGQVAAIVEHADATKEQRQIDEVSTSIFCFRRSLLAPALRRLSPENAQGEYYLPDVVAVLHGAGYQVASALVEDSMEARGVNDRAQLAEAEAELRRRTNGRLLREGVGMLDPDHTYVDVTVRVGRDVILLPGTFLQGHTVVRSGAQLGPDTRLVDCVVGEGAVIEYSVAKDTEIGAGAMVGPFVYLAPGSHVPAGGRVMSSPSPPSHPSTGML